MRIPLAFGGAVGDVVSAHFANKDRITAEMLTPLLDLNFARSALNAHKESLSLLRPGNESGLSPAKLKAINLVIDRNIDRIERDGVDLLQGETVEEVKEKTLNYWKQVAA